MIRRWWVSEDLFCINFHYFLSRARIERQVLGLKDWEPLDPAAMQRSLGPGYRRGYYAWPELTARPNNCILGSSAIDTMTNTYQRLIGVGGSSFIGFLENPELVDYHNDGHNFVGECQGSDSAMVYTQTSARDPIFYRSLDNFVLIRWIL